MEIPSCEYITLASTLNVKNLLSLHITLASTLNIKNLLSLHRYQVAILLHKM